MLAEERGLLGEDNCITSGTAGSIKCMLALVPLDSPSPISVMQKCARGYYAHYGFLVQLRKPQSYRRGC